MNTVMVSFAFSEPFAVSVPVVDSLDFLLRIGLFGATRWGSTA